MKYFFFLLIIAIGSCNNSNPAKQSNDGFIPLFDGKTLAGWQGDSSYWRMENGVLIGETTAANPLKTNTFLIWRGGTTKDFEMKASFKITPEGNSGINYRSEEVEGIPFALKGYQADFDGKNVYTGLNYEERGRAFLAKRGEKARIETGKPPIILEQLGNADTLLSRIRTGDWNDYHVVAKGNNLRQYINDILMSEVTDDDTVHRKMSGLLGLQIHTGPPMKVQYKNVQIKQE